MKIYKEEIFGPVLSMMTTETYEEALKYDVKVSGSEVVGLVTKSALLDSGKFYSKKNKQNKYNENQLIELAVEKLGLNDLYHFEANKKIIENFI